MSSYLFLDTEWADTAGSELVSIALISDNGRHRFYAECAQLPETPTRFVAEIVYPLLERGSSAMDEKALSDALRAFFDALGPVYVLADYPNDVRLLRSALAGGGSDANLPSTVVTTVMDKEGSTAEWVEEWFRERPALAARRHHAMVDAQALRMAWLRVTAKDDSLIVAHSAIQWDAAAGSIDSVGAHDGLKGLNDQTNYGLSKSARGETHATRLDGAISMAEIGKYATTYQKLRSNYVRVDVFAHRQRPYERIYEVTEFRYNYAAGVLAPVVLYRDDPIVAKYRTGY